MGLTSLLIDLYNSWAIVSQLETTDVKFHY